MICRGFVDLLFILLCSTIVLLAQSVPLRGLLAEPAEAGLGGTRALHGDELALISVTETGVASDAGTGETLAELEWPQKPDTLIIVPSNENITHHRIMQVWREAQQAGFEVELGVQPEGKS